MRDRRLRPCLQAVDHAKDIVVASPSYLTRDGLPATPGQLNTHQLLAAACGASRCTWKFSESGTSFSIVSTAARKAYPRFAQSLKYGNFHWIPRCIKFYRLKTMS